ncbi:MAG: helix-turn-helix transcriptional regulator [Sulfurimonas sp.]|uniref:helix-turn-helix domain-containing protein n=1 Tax=Sulfurimonas sp. TaxID=2022749 RepID=UPI00261AAF40|nr:helix-turn-helix transcriptional regulator [Sulfurimonas sp.]MDD5372211.1 helix-turn-helix transcriptional regulator [Sulfurimonas sp.]
MYEQLDIEANELLNVISSNVVKIRKAKGYSQLKLATEMGYSSASYLGCIEIRKNGQHFNITQLHKISKILDVPIAQFFEPLQEE